MEILNNKWIWILIITACLGYYLKNIFYKAISELKVVDLHPGKQKPYVIVYGVANCPYTARAKERLNQMGIKYEYIDLNSDAARYMGELPARLQASGDTNDSYTTPL